MIEIDAKYIEHYLALETAIPEHVDLIFVFGTSQIQPAYIALNLLEQYKANHVVLTGGQGRTGRHR